MEKEYIDELIDRINTWFQIEIVSRENIAGEVSPYMKSVYDLDTEYTTANELEMDLILLDMKEYHSAKPKKRADHISKYMKQDI